MRTHLAALVAATALVAAPLVAVAGPASAATCTAPEVLGTEVSPTNVIVGTSKVKSFDIYTDVAKNGCSLSSVKVTVRSPKNTAKNLTMQVVSVSDGVTTYAYTIELKASALKNSEAGLWTATSVTRWSGGAITSKDAFRVVRAAKLTTNAKPEPVTAGHRLVVTGKLTRANWETRKYAGYTKRKVQLEFRPTGGTYGLVSTVTSHGKGAVQKTVTADVDGCYRFVFTGSSTTRKVTSKADCVDVR
ncbi:hypothetical protein [uncultured Friedmanniella sp.]|uniref:hypothetical protein n=1 Tax=uncultured Friedmanniella sp. TaxID=335381 RepID=UPI0035CC74E6